jgi:cell division cycle 14
MKVLPCKENIHLPTYIPMCSNGDMHEVVRGKFFAFKGPTGRRRALGCGRYSLIPSDYFDVWRSKNITTIVRLNTKEYDRNVVVQGGFKHIDLFFIDCSTPSDAIVDRFLRIAESEQGAMAVHCLAGLGRTGTLIALYMMKHYKFTAREAMGWLRVCRPGSVIGPQQQYRECNTDPLASILCTDPFSPLGVPDSCRDVSYS